MHVGEVLHRMFIQITAQVFSACMFVHGISASCSWIEVRIVNAIYIIMQTKG